MGRVIPWQEFFSSEVVGNDAEVVGSGDLTCCWKHCVVGDVCVCVLISSGPTGVG